MIDGWYHVTDNKYAHRFENDYPYCQMSDFGHIIDSDKESRLIMDICPDCKAIFKSRIIMAWKKAGL